MSVAKPWMLALPAPATSHWLGGVPGLLFSQTIWFVTGSSQGAASALDVIAQKAAITATPSRNTRIPGAGNSLPAVAPPPVIPPNLRRSRDAAHE